MPRAPWQPPQSPAGSGASDYHHLARLSSAPQPLLSRIFGDLVGTDQVRNVHRQLVTRGGVPDLGLGISSTSSLQPFSVDGTEPGVAGIAVKYFAIQREALRTAWRAKGGPDVDLFTELVCHESHVS